MARGVLTKAVAQALAVALQELGWYVDTTEGDKGWTVTVSGKIQGKATLPI